MISKELKEMIEIAGGKVIVSEGEVEKSYIVMKLEDYLAEKRKESKASMGSKEKSNDTAREEYPSGLTENTKLDKIEVELDDFYRREREKELEEMLKAEREEYSYESL